MEVIFMLHCQKNKAAVNIYVHFFGTDAQECSLSHVRVYLDFKETFKSFSKVVMPVYILNGSV